jgi:hypothetical protein
VKGSSGRDAPSNLFICGGGEAMMLSVVKSLEATFEVPGMFSAGRAIAQAVSSRPPSAGARIRIRVSLCAIRGGQ